MRLTVLFAERPEKWDEWEAPLTTAFAAEGLSVRIGPDIGPPEEVDYIVYSPESGLSDFSPFVRLRAVFSMWAGVERIVSNPSLRVPLARMVDPGLTEGMVEYVIGHVLRYHLGMDAHIRQAAPLWRTDLAPPLARDRTVGILGLGALGQACAEAAAALNFKVLGWSRRPKSIAGISCHHADDGLSAVLARAEILVLLLPQTAQTTDLMNAARFALMPRGSALINPGRGPLVADEDLLAALDGGQLSHATLDVFRREPLPKDHPFWAHEKVTITPHIAAQTHASTAAGVIAANIARHQRGEEILNLVDRGEGY